MDSFAKKCVSLTLFLMVSAAGLFAQTHFTFTSNTGNNMTVVVPASINPIVNGSAIVNGDEIGVFTPAGLRVGAAVWSGSNVAITAWGDDDQTTAVDGLKAGDTLKYRIWDASLSAERQAVVAYTSGGPVYSVDGMAILSSLAASASTYTIDMPDQAGPLPAAFDFYTTGPSGVRIAVPGIAGCPGVPVRVSLYDARGRLLSVLVNKEFRAGYYDLKPAAGSKAALTWGICRMDAKSFSRTIKCMWVKK